MVRLPQIGGGEVELDPYSCLPKRNQKYASECVELFLSDRGANVVGKAFKHFANVEVVWLNGNRLSRIDNLEENFRIKEVYAQDNMLVSLAGLRTFKFLKVLLASNNQLRNLEKQLTLLRKFVFLQKLDLFSNPVAEEPDYRLRLIYNIPQVETLDRSAVKGPERLKADEIVPNLDKVTSGGKVVSTTRKKGWGALSVTEKDCFRISKQIRESRAQEEQDRLQKALKGYSQLGAYSDTKVLVAGLPEGATKPQVCEAMEAFGAVAVKPNGKFAVAMAPFANDVPSGCAVVRFERVAAARKALEAKEIGNWTGVTVREICPPPTELAVTVKKFNNSTQHELVALTDWEKGGSSKENYAGLLDFVAAQMPGVDKFSEEQARKLMQLLAKEAGGVLGKVLIDPRAGVAPELGEGEAIPSPRSAAAAAKRSSMGGVGGGAAASPRGQLARQKSSRRSGVGDGQEEEGVVDFWAKWQENPAATVPLKEILEWVGGLRWRFEEDEVLDEHLRILYDDAHKLATTVDEIDTNHANVLKLTSRISILEGMKTKKHEARLAQTERYMRKEAIRGDLLHQRILTQDLVEDENGKTKKLTSMSERSRIYGGDQKHGL